MTAPPDQRVPVAGRYLGTVELDGTARLWWSPGGGAPREPLPNVGGRSPNGPNWGYVGNGPLDAAETILCHATGDTTFAAIEAVRFCRDHLTSTGHGEPLDLPARTVHAWLAAHGIAVTPSRPQVHPTPVDGHPDRHAVSLDSWDLLTIDPPPAVDDPEGRARVAVADLDQPGEYLDDRTVALLAPGDEPTRTPGARVTVDDLPFGGWAIQVDGADVAIVERDPTSGHHARVAVYDRTPDSGFLVLDATVRYRQAPHRPGVDPAERLRRLSDTIPSPEALTR